MLLGGPRGGGRLVPGLAPRAIAMAAGLLFSPAARAQDASEESALDCQDGLDNDLDGATDCADPGCSPWSFCAGNEGMQGELEAPTVEPEAAPSVETPPPPSAPGAETSLEACTDRIDNDGDGALDCLDPDCGWTFCRRERGEVEPAETSAPSSASPAPAPAAPSRPRSVWDDAGPGPAARPSGSARPRAATSGLAEDRSSWYFEVGAFFRYVLFPGFLIDALARRPAGVEAPFLANPAAGLAFGARRGGFEVVTSLWWAGYMHEEFLSGEHSETDWPIFHDWSDLSALVLSVDLLWSWSVADWVAISAGFGGGVMLVLGNPTVTSAVPLEMFPDVQYEGDTVGDARFARCDQVWGRSCAGILWEAPEPYVDAPDLDLWPVVPWFDVLLGLRFRPHRHVAIDVDGGFGVGFFAGARVSYVI